MEEYQQLSAVFTGSVSESIDSLMGIYESRFRFNGSVFIAYHGMPVYHEQFGYSDFTKKTPVNKNMPFQLASVSKQFTAVSVLMLIEKGLLNYGDTVSRIIPEFPYPRVTVEQLLHHTAGMPNYMWLLEHKWEEGKPAYNDDIIRLMNKHETNLYFRPGYRYDYSNTGYAVLAYLVEVVSEMSYPDFVKEFIFDPLGMYNSFVYSNALNRDYPEKLRGYYRRWRRYYPIKETVHDGVVGDKGVYSTAADLFKWDQALYTEQLLSDSTKERAFTPLKIRKRWDYPYGYGFRLKTVDGKKVVYHTGLWEGFRTNLMRYIEDKNTIIVLNHTNANVNNVMIKRIERILDRDLKITPTQEIVDYALKNGVEEGMKMYLRYRREQKPVNEKKILEAAEFLSSINKPAASSILIDVYQQVVETMTLKDRADKVI
jgi:CubicO group peptidase (beta-lactamase class C family)